MILYSRSLYVEKILSEGFHTGTIGTLGPGLGGGGGWGWRLKSRTPLKIAIIVLKFSRSPYLDNHSSESIDTWAIDTL